LTAAASRRPGEPSPADEPGSTAGLRLVPFHFWTGSDGLRLADDPDAGAPCPPPPGAAASMASEGVAAAAVDGAWRQGGEIPPRSEIGASGQRGAPTCVARLSALMAAHFAELGLPQAEPLRWAITAVDPRRGLQLEGIALAAGPAPAGSTDPAPAPPDAGERAAG